MRRFLVLAVVLCFAVLGLSAQGAVDSISKASTGIYYAKSSLVGEDLWRALEARQCAISVATVNADGSPNAAIVIPGVTKDRLYLMFGLAPNQTGVNLRERGFAVVTAYIYNPSAADKLERNRGARIIVEYVSDPELSARLREENKDKGAAPTTIFTRIVKVLPLG